MCTQSAASLTVCYFAHPLGFLVRGPLRLKRDSVPVTDLLPWTITTNAGGWHANLKFQMSTPRIGERSKLRAALWAQRTYGGNGWQARMEPTLGCLRECGRLHNAH